MNDSKIIKFGVVALAFLTSACDPSPEDAELTPDAFKTCESKGSSYYNNECEGKTLIFNAIVKNHSSDGVHLSVRQACNSAEEMMDVDAPNLDYDFSKSNFGKCVKLFAEIGNKNFTTPDVRVIEVMSIETSEQTAKRQAEMERQTAEAKAKEEAKKAAELDANKNNAKWLSDNYGIAAAVRCEEGVERLAKYSHEWTDGLMESKFPSFFTKTTAPYVLTVTGDKIKFQNGFGAWKNQRYACDYNVKTKKVLRAYIR